MFSAIGRSFTHRKSYAFVYITSYIMTNVKSIKYPGFSQVGWRNDKFSQRYGIIRRMNKYLYNNLHLSPHYTKKALKSHWTVKTF